MCKKKQTNKTKQNTKNNPLEIGETYVETN